MRNAGTLEETQKAETGFLETDFDTSFCDLGKGSKTIHYDLVNSLE